MTRASSGRVRLVHTSDWHIGQELHGHGRDEEHDAFLAWLLDRLVELDADALVVTGDIYDVANPPVTAMARFYGLLRDALARCPRLQIVVVGGNHDSAARISLPGALLGRGRVHLVGQIPRREGELDVDALVTTLAGHDGKPAAVLAAIPFCRPGDLGRGDLAALYSEVTAAALDRAQGLPVVLTGHLHVSGGDVSVDSERRIVIGGEEAQASTLFDARAAYVALGHLHRPQNIPGGTVIRYAGSPLPLSVAERDYRHSISVVDVGPEGVTLDVVEIPRLAPFLSLPVGDPLPLDELEISLAAFDFGDPATPGSRPFVEVSVLLDRPQPGVSARVHAALAGKPVRLTRVRSVFPEAAVRDRLDRGETLDELEPAAVFASLHADRHGGEPDEALARAFAKLVVAVQSEDLP
ncbi:exonuclease SbcCD subunit D C-terminal domain-containing protein [Sphingomonas sp. BAUL-RG-20F-R05-02]|uniref:exonuclease SbcCD subunit D C-terminal domain-containing protein n=1 Tax=Sphingomonas sp. BAUL-RG-20F-R05-02 TaxID=2914830 RepID=UPI001F5A2979|nr:exonuclease SbcCD subunit D C-terminal domain-containing protein [Sphingomonas sp. BAUL-RG-20F-R05-02]